MPVETAGSLLPDAMAHLAVADCSGTLAQLVESAAAYAEAATAASTRDKYRSAFNRFAKFADDIAHGLPPGVPATALPAAPEVLALYLVALASDGLSPATIAGSIAAIARVHESHGHVPPHHHRLVREVWRGIRRQHGRPAQGADALSTTDLAAMVAELRKADPHDLELVMCALAWDDRFTPGAIANLRVEHLTDRGDGRLDIVLPFGRWQKDQTIDLDAAASHLVHRVAVRVGHGPLLTRETATGERRTLTTEGVRRARTRYRTTYPSREAAMQAVWQPGIAAHRDVALLLLSFTCGNRASETSALRWSDLTVHPDGLVVLIRRAKNDQEGVGHRKAVGYGHHPETCAVVATLAWRDRLTEVAGEHATAPDTPVFPRIDRHGNVARDPLSPDAVNQVVKQAAHRAGIPGRITSHSLRVGLVTALAGVGVTEASIATHTGHQSLDQVRGYVRGALPAASPTRLLDL